MRYIVTALMSSVLRTVVDAVDEDDALRLAKALADDGAMEEQDNSGDISGWEVQRVARKEQE